MRPGPGSISPDGLSAKPPRPDALWAEIPPDAQAAILGLVQSLEQPIAALEAGIKQDSSNSSRPPSTEPPHINRHPPRPSFADLLGLSISTGMVAELRCQAGEVLAGPMAEFLQAVRRAGADHVDETGWRESGRKAWHWIGATAEATASLVRRSRGRDALESLLGGVLVLRLFRPCI